MTEVGGIDLSRLLHSKLNESHAIVLRHKRKLRELLSVATLLETLPGDGLNKPDATTANATEAIFLQANDVSQGKKLQVDLIPAKVPYPIDALKRSFGKYDDAATRKPQPIAQTPAPPPERIVPPTPNLPQSVEPAVASKPATPVPAPARPCVDVSQQKPTPPQTQASSPASSTPVAKPQEDAPIGKVNPAPEQPAPANEDAVTDASAHAQPAQRRQTQVSFPPGTKGSPSEADVVMKDASAPEQAKAGADPAPATLPDVNLTPLKPVTDAARVPDALSSPGSTAPSAATPAIHDASTDTSPDHDGTSYMETDEPEKDEEGEEEARCETQEKVKGEVGNEAREEVEVRPERGHEQEEKLEDREEDSSAQDQSKMGISPEDQLLQESIQSTEAKASAEKESVTETAASPSEPSPEKVTPRTDYPSERPDAGEQHATETPVAKIPDSQEEESMHVVKDETAQPANRVPAAQEPNVEEASAPTPPPAKISQEPKVVSERAVTRVSSGAMRPKSVDEIVGGHSRKFSESSINRALDAQLTPTASAPQTPTASRPRQALRKYQPKQGKPVVVFGKQASKNDEMAVIPSVSPKNKLLSDDYYTPLFIQGFANSSSWMQPLEKMLYHANKTVTTSDAALAIQDHQACKVLRRVYHLQNTDKWSLRQPKRCQEPNRPPAQWDVVLQEMKWMRTDFRQERKWKRSVASMLAQACLEWHEASPEERELMQVKARIPPKPLTTQLITNDHDNQPTPELLPGDAASPTNDDELADVLCETISPSTIFALQEDDVVFGLAKTAASDKLLEELPMYGAPLQIPVYDFATQECDPDASWKRPALPLNKYVEGQMRLKTDKPPKKRSRFEFGNEESDDEDAFVSERPAKMMKLSPQSTDCALFNPELKHIRDRLHAGHQFRPPTDHSMPLQSFFENRNPSQWTQPEDDELRSLVREYSYNWPLISSILRSKSIYSSGAERRTPWECFERWIALEGLPADMGKTQYFKMYMGRIDNAQRIIQQHNIQAAQQAAAASGNGNAAVMPIKRRQSTPIRVERRRNQKHLMILDAMRKLAKKRETALQKQQHQASQNAANRKPAEPMAKPNKTPSDYSQLRHERDQAVAQRMAEYAKRQEAQRRATVQARQGQNGQIAGTPGTQGANGQQLATGAGQTNPAQRMNGQNPAAVAAAQGRRQMSMQAPNGMGGPAIPAQMNGSLVAPQMNGNAPQAQMQGMQGQHRMAMPGHQQPADPNMMMRAQRVSEQQRVAVQMQQAQHHQPQQHLQQQQQQGHQQHGQHAQQQPHSNAGTPRPPSQHNSPPNMPNGMANNYTQQNYMNNAQAIMAQFNANAQQNGHGSPPINGLHMPAGSPGPRNNSQLPAEINARINQLETQFRGKNPNLTPEAARQMATEHIARIMAAHRQTAMSAAAGGSAGLPNGITTSPHQYAALLRAQQQQQQQQAAQQGHHQPNHQPNQHQVQQHQHQHQHQQPHQLPQHQQQQQHAQQQHAQQSQQGQQGQPGQQQPAQQGQPIQQHQQQPPPPQQSQAGLSVSPPAPSPAQPTPTRQSSDAATPTPTPAQ
ncbi:hypothetical protein N3K66_008265 [Trichothecium roseum]|uniref:Uncharacterized protein n=1 Tax=Trichothecium roseum TaxID=47278 RepID=A0ACC0UT05_9HYPO|nr:hypothetical protein N3K66_008265 [Trichothecium roseum]